MRYLPQEPDLGGFDSTGAYVAAGLSPGDDPYRARSLLDLLGLTGAENPARLSGGEAGARHWPACWRPPRTSCCSTSRPTISTCPPSPGWKPNLPACAPPWC